MPERGQERELLRGLANLRKIKPEESYPPPQHRREVDERQMRQPQRQVDPNLIYCQSCQRTHHKDLHRQSLRQQPVYSVASVPSFVKKGPSRPGIVALQSSKPTETEIAQQKRALDNILGKRSFREPDVVPPMSKVKHMRRNLNESADEEEEDNDFDYDDEFIVRDDDDGVDYKKHLRKVTNYNPEAYDDVDFDDRLMEVRDYETLQREDMRSRAIGRENLLLGRYEDEIEEQRLMKMKKRK